MTNYEYISFINSKLVLYKKTNTYYINIGPLFGYANCRYSIFIVLGDKILKSYTTTKNDIYDLISSVKNNELHKLLTGTENLKFGVDYLISESLYNYIILNELDYEYSDEYVNYVLPDYIIDLFPNENDYEILSNLLNLEYYMKLNDMNTFEFSKEELDNFYITFCDIILNNAYVDNTSNEYYIYKTVLEYWANGGTDMASTNISLILNSSINVYNTNQSYTICGCNTNNDNNLNNINTLSCNELYKNAMLLHLKEMLGNSDFYESWFMLEDGNVNEVMIKKLTLLIDEFLKLDYNINNTYTDKKLSKCNCEVISGDDCNFSTIKDYKNVLYWVNENKILENKNKIYILGTNFGEILPKLIF